MTKLTDTIMTYDDNNIFAQILKGKMPCQKVAENEYALAFKDINPRAPVHVLVIPKGTYTSFSDFADTASPSEIIALTALIKIVVEELAIAQSGYRLISNTGDDGNQEVAHYHIHILGGKALGGLLG